MTILVQNLVKKFKVAQPINGNLLKYIFPDYTEIIAVNDISFEIKKGEKVAFIGPNGAGKTTTIRNLTGLSSPTSGNINVLGLNPFEKRKELCYKIGAVFGSNSKLWQHLSPKDNFNLICAIYDIKPNYNDLVDKFEINSYFDKPVAKLSLGQKMRCELVATLLYNPEVLLLDEPTIGLDINAKTIIRDMLKNICNQKQSTLLLTSHDVGDIEQICDRVIIIDKGKIILDSSLDELKRSYIKTKVITVLTEMPEIKFSEIGVKVLSQTPHNLKLEVDLFIISVEKIVSDLISNNKIVDLSIENPSLESIFKQIYK